MTKTEFLNLCKYRIPTYEPADDDNSHNAPMTNQSLTWYRMNEKLTSNLLVEGPQESRKNVDVQWSCSAVSRKLVAGFLAQSNICDL